MGLIASLDLILMLLNHDEITQNLFDEMTVCIVVYLCVLLFSPLVLALQDLYKSLSNPEQLRRWRLEGGDPCGEAWMGVSCSGSSIVDL